MPQYNYFSDKVIHDRFLASKLADKMPAFMSDYLLAKVNSTAASSLLQYTYDIMDFLQWWHDSVPELAEHEVKDISLESMFSVTARDINEYLYSISSTQNPKTLARKCTALNSLFDYLVRMCNLEYNPMTKVERPKLRKDKRIITLTDEEISVLLNAIKDGCPGMSERQKKYLEHTKTRDFAIVVLLLTSGIRVSELVGLDISDIFFQSYQMQVTRKGGKKETIAISDEAISAIEDYLCKRSEIEPEAQKDKNALFLSTQNTRMTPQAVENVVIKYTTALGFGKRITPHKLRKTCGTKLYQETRDIYLVASALGHENVKTTTEHYVASTLDDLQNVRNIIKIVPENKKN